MHENGYGTDKSDSKAMLLYKGSAEKNYIHSLDALGRFYEWGKGGLEIDYGEALRLYTLSSQQGSSGAYYHLGELYYNGKGVVKDNAKAAEFYEKSADRGKYSATKKLAEMNRDGDGIPQNIGKALTLYERGVGLGISTYMYDLSFWYFDGKGVVTDIAKGMQLLTDAAEKQHIDALNKLGNIYYRGHYGHKVDYSLSFKYYDEAVQLGDVDGCFYLGYMYSMGYGIEKNLQKAIEYYTRCDSASANNNLANIYKDGQDLKLAAEYYQKAMDKGDVSAILNLARMHQYGSYFRRDMEKAVELYKMAAKKGDKEAINWLKEHNISE
jgi:TPR repeat protein